LGTIAGVNPDDWLGLDPIDDGRTGFVLTPRLARFDGKLFGGTGLAVVVAALEAATQRHALWATVQFVGSADEGDRIDVAVEVLAAGHNTTQARVTATSGGRVVLSALGSTARVRNDGFGHRFGVMPDVSSPDDSPPFTLGFPTPPPEMRRSGPFSVADFRMAKAEGESQSVWVRLRDDALTHASVAYLADFVPNAVLRAAGKLGGGTSLDNSIRFGPPIADDAEWLLIDSDPYFADNGFVHGAARLWTADGTLIGVASQTAAAKIFAGIGPDGTFT
jgi:acyl-CoA thioesterase